jgi:hypothetical protein
MKSIQEQRSWDNRTLEPILEKLSTIASGATTIGSTGCAPDDKRKHRLLNGISIDFIVDKVYTRRDFTPIGRDLRLVEKQLNDFWH